MNVAEELRDHLRPIDELVLLPGNPRQGDVGSISESLKRFGQLKPIVVDADGVILAGNHTYQAARFLGWTEIAAVTVDLVGSEATGFALADNRLSDLASYDNDLLIEQLRSLDRLEGIGYDLDDLDDLIAFSQETFRPEVDGTSSTATINDRELQREAARAAGMEIRSLVFLLTPDEYALALRVLASRNQDTNTEAFLDLLAEHDA